MRSGFDSPVCFVHATIRQCLALPLALLILTMTACGGGGSSSNGPSVAGATASSELSAATQQVSGAGFSEASISATGGFDDGDSISQDIDNCPFVRNRDQADADADGRGDRCECGDASGDGLVDTIDAQLTQRCAIGEFAPNACPFSLCDVTGDGVCNTIDARTIQRVAVGEIAKSALSCYQLAAPTVALQAADSDGDGLADAVEIVGWTIQVDELGLGTSPTPSLNLLTIIDVQSANLGGDTDGDGLDDMTEYLVRSHPGKSDTDGDGLGDAEEWNQWLTSPVSVDSDGDARGPNHDLPPKPALFDGLELDPSVSFRTSPTLDDTDGDGKTDFEEIDDPSRSPLIAELPAYTLTQVGNVDVRLNVEFAEAVGEQSQYGTEAATSETTSQSRGGSDQWSINASFTATLGSSATVGAEAGVTGVGTSASGTVSSEFSASTGFGAEHTTTWTEESSRTFQEQYSEYVTDTLTRTETAASGSISMGLVVENTGLSTFEISSLGVTVLQLQRDPEPSFRTLATLLPALQGVTLAPGETSGIIQVADNDLNAAVVKDFLANPTTLTYDTGSIELLGADGINFDFLKENVFPRTAVVAVDYGDGRLERYRVATNVDRAPDSSFLGVSMDTILAEILGIDFATAPVPSIGGTTLARIEATADVFDTAKWASFLSSERITPPSATFEDITLAAGDEMALSYLHDRDEDGLVDRLEELFGSLDTGITDTTDTDGDGLTDFQEVVEGWFVSIFAARDGSGQQDSYKVFSDPRSADTDGDGVTDDKECALVSGACSGTATDPTLQDTDGDDISDAIEQCTPACFIPPSNTAAIILYVDASCRTEPGGNCGSGDGLSWANAFGELRDALADAQARAATTNFFNWSNEIWVAQGVYKPALPGALPASTFTLLSIPAGGSSQNFYPKETVPIALYGGFVGGETKRDQRVADALFNGTELSGDLNGDDGDNFTNIIDNSYHVVVSPGGRKTLLDGFIISGGNADDGGGIGNTVAEYGGGIQIIGSDVTLRNLQLRLNRAERWGGGIAQNTGFVTIEDSILFRNHAAGTDLNFDSGGGIWAFNPGIRLTLDNVSFLENSAASNGGGLWFNSNNGTGELTVRDSVFENNTAGSFGGGALIQDDASVINTVFRGNESSIGGGLAFQGGEGDNLVLAQDIFSGNVATQGAGVELRAAPTTTNLPVVHIINSSFGLNTGATFGSGLSVINTTVNPFITTVENSVFVGNGDGSEAAQIQGPATTTLLTVRNNCIQNLSVFSGLGNVLADDAFSDPVHGNLRLKANSICVDAGSNLVDFDPRTPGFQPLPDFDLDGKVRVVDGDGDGNAIVDTGAYEVQAE